MPDLLVRRDDVRVVLRTEEFDKGKTNEWSNNTSSQLLYISQIHMSYLEILLIYLYDRSLTELLEFGVSLK